MRRGRRGVAIAPAFAVLGMVAAGCPNPASNFDAGPLPPPDPDPIDCPGLSITGVTPPAGPVGEDRIVNIAGTGFNNGSTVQFEQPSGCGGAGTTVDATGVVVLGPGLIEATFPAPAQGFWNVRVTRGGSDDCVATATRRNAFRSAPTTSGNFASCQESIDPSIDPMGVDIARVVAGDFNCDCRPDAILALRGESNIYLEGLPDGTIDPAQLDGVVDLVLRSGVFVGLGLTEEIIAVDLDADGDEDIVTAVAGPVIDGGGIHIFENATNCPGAAGSVPIFIERTNNLPDPVTGFKDVAAGDLDGDGRPDLIGVATTFGEGLILMNLGGFGFSTVNPGVSPQVLVTGGAHDALIADLDLDGLGDIVAEAATPGTGPDQTTNGMVLLNTGTGYVDVTAACGLATGYSPKLKDTTYFIGAADLDLDGDVDLVVDATAGGFVFDNRATEVGPGTCSMVRTDVPGLFAGYASNFTKVEDIDTDGDVDVWNGYDGFARNINGVLDSAWPAGSILPGGANVEYFGVATPDLTESGGDGILDLLATQNGAPYLNCYVQGP